VKKHTRLNAECYNPLKIPRPVRDVNAFAQVSNDFEIRKPAKGVISAPLFGISAPSCLY
jgi:hypothetical protein